MGGSGCEESPQLLTLAERRDADSFGIATTSIILRTLSKAVASGSLAARNDIEMGLSPFTGAIGTSPRDGSNPRRVVLLENLAPSASKPGSPGFGSGLTLKPVGAPITLDLDALCSLLLCRLGALASALLVLQKAKVMVMNLRHRVRSMRFEAEDADARRCRDFGAEEKYRL